MADLQARLQAAVGDVYRLEKELGGGGMSRLFLATEASLHRQVVIKLLPPELASEVSAARFKQEIELAAHLQHPNILPVLTAGAKDDLLFYVMPFVSGESLRHRLTREGRLPVADAVRILREVADALSHAHAEGVIHRDIKPENILLEGGHAVLTDFGVARAVTESRSGGRLTDTGLALGTPGYMSPEQAAGERNIDARADVYALAVVGYEMLAGVPPFAGPTAQAVMAAHLTATPTLLTDARPETPPGVANAIARALAKDPNVRLGTAAEFRDALEGALARAKPAPRWVLPGAVAVGVLVALGVALTIRRSTPRVALDPNLVAVAPFNVLDQKLELWREGLVDLLSRNLDGAGALRTLAPTIAIKHSAPRADASAAAALGQSTGARFVVFGTLTSEGPDAARLLSSVYDVKLGRVVGEVERRDESDRMNRLTDSLTVGLLRALGALPSAGLPRFGSIGTTSLPALKAFLQGEQAFRQAAWDTAVTYFQRAVALDSGFALAWRRMSTVLGWQVTGGESLSVVYDLRAAALNHGLAPRDSMLVLADSLEEALFSGSADRAWRDHHRRLFATLEEAARRYPSAPEVWYELGDARVHFPLVGRTTPEQTLAAFDRAIALDSAFAESYIHAITLAVALEGPTVGRRYARALLTHAPSDQSADAVRLVAALLAGPGVRPGELQRSIDSARTPVLFNAWATMEGLPDSAETAVRLARAIVTSPPSGVGVFDNPGFRHVWVSVALASRGHLRQAFAAGGVRSNSHQSELHFLADMSVLGGIPAESAGAQFKSWLANPILREPPTATPFGFNIALLEALPWWTARRDTGDLRTFAQRMESLARGSREYADLRPWLVYAAMSARAYLALARRDSADALRRFVALPDTICPCIFDQIVTAQLLTAAGRYREAVAVFHGWAPDAAMLPATGLWRLERARAEERVDMRDQALADYEYVTALWRNADAELQPYVAEATAALERLGGKPR